MTHGSGQAGEIRHVLSGLTLVELLLAATIFSILLVGVAGHLRGSVIAWRRATSSVERIQQTRVALDRLDQDLANAFVFEPSGTWTPQSVFAHDSLQFYTVRQGGDDAEANGRAWFVTYRIAEANGTRALIRAAQTVQEAASNVSVTEEPLLASVEQMAIRYGAVPESEAGGSGASEGELPQRIEWRSEWTDPARLPKLVEVTVQLDETFSKTPHNAPRQLRRVFMIPSGSLTPSEGTS